MRIAMHVCPTKFLLARKRLPANPRILDIGCGNNSPSTTKQWFQGCHYSGADIVQYNNSAGDLAAIDTFYALGVDGSGYDAIPDASFDFIILHHVLEHIPEPTPILAAICEKLKPGGVIWIAFPSLKSLSLPSPLHFCDDPSHVYIPHVREVANVLLSNNVRVLHAGRSKAFIRTALGVVMLPLALLRRAVTGRLSGKGLWYVLGFEDCVFGQRLTDY
jgi:SAM-dependent methyltransferase